MSIYNQNWDGTTPPAVDSAWNVAAVYTTTASPLGGIVPISTPNVLWHLGSDNLDHYATWNTLDGVGGDVVVQAYFNALGITTHTVMGVTARANASPIVGASSTFYRAYIDLAAGSGNIDAVVGGTVNNLVSLTASVLVQSDWYLMIFALVGNSLEFSVQRMSDGYWLAPSDVFQSAAAVFLSVTDSSISGQGYSGIYSVQHSSSIYSDNWQISASSTASSGSSAIVANPDTFAGVSPGTVPFGRAGILLNRDLFAGTVALPPPVAAAAITAHEDLFAGASPGQTPAVGSSAITVNADIFAGLAGTPSVAAMAITMHADTFSGAAAGGGNVTATMAITAHRDTFAGVGVGPLVTFAMIGGVDNPDIFSGASPGTPGGIVNAASMAIVAGPNVWNGQGEGDPPDRSETFGFAGCGCCGLPTCNTTVQFGTRFLNIPDGTPVTVTDSHGNFVGVYPMTLGSYILIPDLPGTGLYSLQVAPFNIPFPDSLQVYALATNVYIKCGILAYLATFDVFVYSYCGAAYTCGATITITDRVPLQLGTGVTDGTGHALFFLQCFVDAPYDAPFTIEIKTIFQTNIYTNTVTPVFPYALDPTPAQVPLPQAAFLTDNNGTWPICYSVDGNGTPCGFVCYQATNVGPLCQCTLTPTTSTPIGYVIYCAGSSNGYNVYRVWVDDGYGPADPFGFGCYQAASAPGNNCYGAGLCSDFTSGCPFPFVPIDSWLYGRPDCSVGFLAFDPCGDGTATGGLTPNPQDPALNMPDPVGGTVLLMV